MKDNNRFYSKSVQGQGMVEFALAFPLFLLVLFGIIEFSHLFFSFSMVYAASREAVRYGSASGISENGVPYYQDCDGIAAAAVRIGSLAGVEADDVTISYDHGPYTEGSAPLTCPADVELGDRVVVAVEVHFTPILPLVNLPPIPISSSASHTLIKQLDVAGTPPSSPTPKPPTDTPTPLPTATTVTLTPTETELPTETLMPSQTATFTASPTVTATSTSTPLPTDTPTPTATPTQVPTATVCPPEVCTPVPPTMTPTPDCSKFFLSNSLVNGNKFSINLYSISEDDAITVSQIRVRWFSRTDLNSLAFGEAGTLWSGTSPSPFTYTSVPGSEPVLVPLTYQTISLQFKTAVQSDPVVEVNLSNGCSAYYQAVN